MYYECIQMFSDQNKSFCLTEENWKAAQRFQQKHEVKIGFLMLHRKQKYLILLMDDMKRNLSKSDERTSDVLMEDDCLRILMIG